MIFSTETFAVLVSLVIGSTSSIWLVADLIRLRRALPYSKETHDRIFGYTIGILMCLSGIAGVIKYHLG